MALLTWANDNFDHKCDCMYAILREHLGGKIAPTLVCFVLENKLLNFSETTSIYIYIYIYIYIFIHVHIEER